MAKSHDQVATQRSLQILLLSSYLMLWIAIANGYPIVYSDTGEYLQDSFTFMQSPYRSIFYSVFIRLASWGMTPWLVVLSQSIITIYVLRCVFRYILQGSANLEDDPILFLGLTLFLAFGTSLPWYVGQIMPDVFSGLAFLSAYLLLYDTQLSVERSVLLSITLVVSVGSHLSNFLSIGFVFLGVLAMRAFDRARPFWPARSTREIIAFLLLPILVSAGVVTLSNLRGGYGFRLSAGTPVFLLARLIESGLAVDYLEQQCTVEHLTPCKYLPNLRDVQRNDFLWGKYPLLTEMGGWNGARQEANRIVSGTIRRYPIRFLIDCGKQMVRQFALFRPEDENFPVRGYTLEVFQKVYPGDVAKYELTRQSAGRLRSDAHKLYPLYEAVFWICFCVSVVFLISSRFQAMPGNRLFLMTVVFLFANALVTGALSGIVDRYQSRVDWLVALCCFAYVVPLLLNRLGPAATGIER